MNKLKEIFWFIHKIVLVGSLSLLAAVFWGVILAAIIGFIIDKRGEDGAIIILWTSPIMVIIFIYMVKKLPDALRRSGHL